MNVEKPTSPPRSGAAAGSALPAASIPFRQFHGDALRSGKKDQLAVVEVHDLVPKLDAVGFQPVHLGLQVVHGKADMVEPQFGEVPNGRVGERVRVAVLQ